jgi:hypothetical protein
MQTRIAAVLVCLHLVCSQALMGQTLMARVEVSTSPSHWSYTLFNEEPANSQNFIKFFSLDLAGPVTVTGTPAGWDFDTDGATFILWFNTDEALPYPNDIAPGTSLGGFELQSTATDSTQELYSLVGWNHSIDDAGLVQFGSTLVPSGAAVVPEPGILAWMGVGVAGLMLMLRRYPSPMRAALSPIAPRRISRRRWPPGGTGIGAKRGLEAAGRCDRGAASEGTPKSDKTRPRLP